MPMVEVWMGPVGLARPEWSSLEMLRGRGGAVSEDEPFRAVGTRGAAAIGRGPGIRSKHKVIWGEEGAQLTSGGET